MSKPKQKTRKSWHRRRKQRGETFAKHVGQCAKRDADKAELEAKIKTLRAAQWRIQTDIESGNRRAYHELRLRSLAG